MGFAGVLRYIYCKYESGENRRGSPRRQARKSAMSIEQFIENEVKTNDVIVFMKGTPQFPMCGFSGQVVQILDYLGVPYKGLNVLENDDLRGGIKTYSNWPTKANSSAAATSSAKCFRQANCNRSSRRGASRSRRARRFSRPFSAHRTNAISSWPGFARPFCIKPRDCCA
jgi:Grx4 family monothiol glutaredoxin